MTDHWTDKAANHLTKIGAPDADPAALAQFGRDWKAARDTWIAERPDTAYRGVAGALITPTGEIVGETVNIDGTYHLTHETAEQYDTGRTVLDMATGAIKRAVGQPVVHITGDALSKSGSTESPILGAIRRAVRDRDEADERVTELMRQARERNIPIARITEAAGLKSRQATYNRLEK